MISRRRIVTTAIAALAGAALTPPAAHSAFSLVRTWGNTANREGSKAPGQFGTGIPTAAEGGDRQFDDPGGIAVEPNGNLLVADPSNHRVNRYDESGKFVGSFGRHGFDPGATRVTGVGRMNLPEGLAVSAGKVFVADSRNDRILSFTTTGRSFKRVARRGSTRGRTTSPWGAAINGSTLYVADQGNYRILRFTTSGRSLGSFGTYSQSGNGFVTAYGLAVDPKNKLVYVTDEVTDRVLAYSLTGAYKGQFGTFGTSTGKFDRVTGIAVDGAGDVYVSDYCNQRIAHFAPGGTKLKEYIGATSVEAPTFLAFGPNGNLYVADHHRMMQFAPTGKAASAAKRPAPPMARAAHRLGSGFC
jgi:tripartite motif-containing protein 71